MATIKMTIISKPKEGSATVFEPGVAPAMRGQGDMNYDCGSCDTRLLENVGYKQVMGIIFKCPGCSAYNKVPPAHYLQ